MKGKKWAVLALVIAGGSACGTGKSCPFGLVQRINYPAGGNAIGQLACCGASTYYDLTILQDDIQIDVINSSGTADRADVFVVNGECTNLFSGPYSGSVANPLCTIYVGPVAAGVTSPRVKIAKGHYHVFVQGWTTNTGTAQYLMEVRTWGQACGGPISP